MKGRISAALLASYAIGLTSSFDLTLSVFHHTRRRKRCRRQSAQASHRRSFVVLLRMGVRAIMIDRKAIAGRLLASLVFITAALSPLCVPAETAVRTVTYDTTYRQTTPVQTAGANVGVLTLTFYKSGIVSGNYRDEFNGTLQTVAGGYAGNKIWFSVGRNGQETFRGTIGSDGRLTGTASGWRGPRAGTLTAIPQKPH